MSEASSVAKGGRRPKLRDAASRRKLLGHIRGGLSSAFACRLLGIADQTLRNEIHRDSEFAIQVQQAEAERVRKLTSFAYKHAKEHPQTCTHLLACLDRTYAKSQDDTITVRQFQSGLSWFITEIMASMPAEHHAKLQDAVERFIEKMQAQSGQLPND